MKDVHLEHLNLNQKIYELSGGEAQRVALAKLFLKNPPIILADEPTASLDPDNAQEIMDLIRSLKIQIVLLLLLPIIQVFGNKQIK